MSDLGAVEQQAERVRMCLSEAGYPHAVVVVKANSFFPDRRVVGVDVASVPPDVMFNAYTVAGIIERCRACWFADRACLPADHHEDCTGDGWDR